MTIKSVLIGVLAFLFSATSFAGDWVSTGGEIFKFDKNPWFVKNIDTVRYCTIIDAPTISASESEIHQSINRAIAYWKDQLNHPRSMSQVNLANQNFVRVGCSENPLLVFKFGYGSLSTSQNESEVEFLKDPRKYVGVAIRKNYDLRHMSGNGVVFISSDIGPNAYRNNGNLVERAWSNSQLLTYALIHEMGHVFGLPHTGTGIMSEVFLDQLLHRNFVQFYRDGPLRSFVTPPSGFEICDSMISTNKFNATFFQLPLTTACIKLVKQSNSKWDLLFKAASNSPYEKAGEIVARMSEATLAEIQPTMVLHLPEGQQVFAANETQGMDFMAGPSFLNLGVPGFYRTVNSRRPHSVYLDLASSRFNGVAEVNGKMEKVISYTPPSIFQFPDVDPIEE